MSYIVVCSLLTSFSTIYKMQSKVLFTGNKIRALYTLQIEVNTRSMRIMCFSFFYLFFFHLFFSLSKFLAFYGDSYTAFRTCFLSSSIFIVGYLILIRRIIPNFAFPLKFFPHFILFYFQSMYLAYKKKGKKM